MTKVYEFKDTYTFFPLSKNEDYLTVQRNHLSNAFTLVAVARLIINAMTVSKEGGELRSTVEAKAAIQFPADAYKTENTVQMQVCVYHFYSHLVLLSIVIMITNSYIANYIIIAIIFVLVVGCN